MTVIVDPDGKPVANIQRDPPKPKSPNFEILRILRLVETAKRTGIAETCSQLHECFKAGWSLSLDQDLDLEKVQATIIMHLDRDANNKLRQKPERWLRMGTGYTEVMEVLKTYIEAEKNQA